MDGFVDPFARLASAAGKIVADGWTSAMLGIWNAGLWLLRLAETFLDSLLTPDLSETGPGAWLYRVMFWIAGALLLIMALVWDAAHLDRRRWGRARPVTLRVAGHALHTNTVNIAVQ